GRLELGAGSRDLALGVDFEIINMHVEVADVSDALAVRGEFRVEERAGAGLQLADFLRRPIQKPEPAREANEDRAAILRKLETGEAGPADPHALAAGLLLGGQVFFAALE